MTAGTSRTGRRHMHLHASSKYGKYSTSPRVPTCRRRVLDPYGAIDQRTARARQVRCGMQPVVAICDLNVAADALEEMSRGSKMVDARGRWIGGATRVILIDVIINHGPCTRRALLRLRALLRES